MSQPTCVHVWASQAAATTAYDSGFAVSVGDLCVLWKAGLPASVGTGLPTLTSGGADAGFSTGQVGTSNNGTSAKASVFYKVLTSSDVTGGNLVGYSANQGNTTTLRIGMFVFRHTNLFNAATALIYNLAFNTNPAPSGVVATMTDVARGVVAVSIWAGVTGSAAEQWTWAGAPTGNTAARDPYSDESSSSIATGGHGATRTDSTGVTVTSGSATIADTHAVASDLGASLAADTNFATGGKYVTAVNVGVGFTASAPASGNGTTLALTQPHYGTQTNTIQADYQEFDVSDTPGNVTLATSTATNTYVAVTCEFQAQTGDRALTVNDLIGLTDTATKATGFARARTDPFGLTDNTTASTTGSSLSRSITDPFGLTDVVPRALTAVLTDNLGFTDTGTANASIPEKITFTDTVAKDFTRTISDSFAMQDTIAYAVPGRSILADRLGLTDLDGISLNVARVISTNQINLTDSITVEKTSGRDIRFSAGPPRRSI